MVVLTVRFKKIVRGNRFPRAPPDGSPTCAFPPGTPLSEWPNDRVLIVVTLWQVTSRLADLGKTAASAATLWQVTSRVTNLGKTSASASRGRIVSINSYLATC